MESHYIVPTMAIALLGIAMFVYRVSRHVFEAPSTEGLIGREISRALVAFLCEQGLRTIAREVKGPTGTEDPLEIVATIVEVTLQTGHYDVLDDALTKVDPTWPSEIVIAFWRYTAHVGDRLPSRQLMWQRFRAQVYDEVLER